MGAPDCATGIGVTGAGMGAGNPGAGAAAAAGADGTPRPANTFAIAFSGIPSASAACCQPTGPAPPVCAGWRCETRLAQLQPHCPARRSELAFRRERRRRGRQRRR
jgi:hypothetical protein